MKEEFFKAEGEVFKITKSPKRNKKTMAEFKDGTKVHFGNENGIEQNKILRKILAWKVKDDPEMKSFREINIQLAKREEFFDRL